ncbi:MAG TPA: DsbA family protein [Jiangellales bacterium]|nr:DsbA family protein [Jiangellales bacterium]
MVSILYADFTSPQCYLASRRVDVLAAVGTEVDWRAVEVDRPLPVTGRPIDPAARAAIEAQLSALAGLLLPGEPLPWTLPRVICRTEAALSGYAEGYGAGVGADLRRVLYTAYWLHGLDIGNPEVLRKLLAGPILRGRSASQPLRENGYAVSVSGAPITTDAWRRIRRWREAWVQLDADALPVLQIDGEPPYSGEAALRRLEKELVAAGADPNPDLPDPARYPSSHVRPSIDWVSRVGGSWAYAWMPSPLSPRSEHRDAARYG